MTEVMNETDEAFMLLVVKNKEPEWYQLAEKQELARRDGKVPPKRYKKKDEGHSELLNHKNVKEYTETKELLKGQRKENRKNMDAWDDMVIRRCIKAERDRRAQYDLANGGIEDATEDNDNQGESGIVQETNLYTALADEADWEEAV